jgi:hypothetical protein
MCYYPRDKCFATVLADVFLAFLKLSLVTHELLCSGLTKCLVVPGLHCYKKVFNSPGRTIKMKKGNSVFFRVVIKLFL